MKFFTAAAVLIVSLFSVSMALPARLAYYQQPSFYYQSRATPQRLMYLQYVQQPSSSQSNARLTNAAAAFVAGETVATGTYLKDDASVEQTIAQETILDNTGANGAQSIAEAYPASSEVEDSQDDVDAAIAGAAEIAEAEAPEEVPAEAEPEDNQVLGDEIDPVAETAEIVPEVSVSLASKPDVQEIPEPSAVELPEEAENDDDADAEEDEEDVQVNVSAGRRVASKAAPAPLPAGTFFPVDFGGASGGAIAVANSFSTGVSGSAKSQAIAYGKPEQPARHRHRRH